MRAHRADDSFADVYSCFDGPCLYEMRARVVVVESKQVQCGAYQFEDLQRLLSGSSLDIIFTMGKTVSSEPWRGPSRIALGIDIGTTHTAISFSHLFEGDTRTLSR